MDKRHSKTRQGGSDIASPTRNSRYRRDGPLSPLRSPMNRKDRENRVCKPKPTRERHASSGSTSWADLVDQCDQQKEELQSYKAYTRKMSESNRRDSECQSVSSQETDSPSGKEIETSEEVLMRRQKQIDYGKSTDSYENYITRVPRSARKHSLDPKTPNKYKKCSRRCFDGMVKAWKIQVHRAGEHTPSQSAGVSSAEATPTTDGKSSVCSNDENTDRALVKRKQLQFGASADEQMDDDDICL